MDFFTWPRVVVVDVEGNGQSPPDLVEVATVPIEAGRVRDAEAFSILIRPPRPITRFASSVHGLTDADVSACPPWAESAAQVGAALGDAWIAAHNASVDRRVLGAHLGERWAPAGVIDTLRICRAVYADVERHTLDAMIARAGIGVASFPGRRHRAAFDAYATAMLLLELAAHFDCFDTLTAAGALGGKRQAPAKTTEEPTLW